MPLPCYIRGAMMARRPWTEVRDVLESALEEPAASRVDFVQRACARRPDLLQEVLGLLSLYDEDFLERAAAFPEMPREIGGYRLVGLIGTGGMGDVYRAIPKDGGSVVAMKLLPQELSFDSTLRARFLREAGAILALDHPRIVRVHKRIEQDGRDAIVMDLLFGRNLKQVLSEGPLELPRALSFALELADGLAYAHARGVVHRDLKPANVMVSPEDHVTILDFGLAKTLSADESAARLTKSGDVVGTAAYMSPEQARGEEVDPRSDVFSFGSLLYELLTGRRAFPGDFIAATFGVAYQEPVDISHLRPAVPADVRHLLRIALQKEREARDLSMVAVRDALRRHAR